MEHTHPSIDVFDVSKEEGLTAQFITQRYCEKPDIA